MFVTVVMFEMIFDFFITLSFEYVALSTQSSLQLSLMLHFKGFRETNNLITDIFFKTIDTSEKQSVI